MSECTDDEVRELERKIFELTNECTDYDTIFNALQNMMTFWMSTLCPDCRKNVARHLKKEVSQMLARANQFAAQRGAPPTCH